MYPVCSSSMFGYKNNSGEILIHPVYDNAHLQPGPFGIVSKEGLWGTVDQYGHTIVPLKYREIKNVRPGGNFLVARDVSHNKLWHIVTFEGNERFSFFADVVGDPTIDGVTFTLNGEGGIVSCSRGRWREVHIEGIQFVDWMFNGRASFATGEELKMGYISYNGIIEISPIYLSALPYANGVAAVQTDEDRWFYINRSGEKIFNTSYMDAKEFSEGLAAVRQHDNPNFVSFIDQNGIIQFCKQLDRVGHFHHGLVAAGIWDSKNGWRWGFLDRMGNWQIKPKFMSVERFWGGIARVKMINTESIYYINKKGDILYPYRLDEDTREKRSISEISH